MKEITLKVWNSFIVDAKQPRNPPPPPQKKENPLIPACLAQNADINQFIASAFIITGVPNVWNQWRRNWFAEEREASAPDRPLWWWSVTAADKQTGSEHLQNWAVRSGWSRSGVGPTRGRQTGTRDLALQGRAYAGESDVDGVCDCVTTLVLIGSDWFLCVNSQTSAEN